MHQASQDRRCAAGFTQQAALLSTIGHAAKSTQQAAHLRIDREIAVHILQVPLRVKSEVVGDGDPQEPLDALPVGLLDAGGDLSALTHACRHGSVRSGMGAVQHTGRQQGPAWGVAPLAMQAVQVWGSQASTAQAGCHVLPSKEAHLRHHPRRSLLCCLQTGSTEFWQRFQGTLNRPRLASPIYWIEGSIMTTPQQQSMGVWEHDIKAQLCK